MSDIKRVTISSVLGSIIAILLAFVLIFNPNGVLNTFVYIAACVFLLYGIYNIYGYIKMNKDYRVYNTGLLSGILLIILSKDIIPKVKDPRIKFCNLNNINNLEIPAIIIHNPINI